MLLRVVDTFSEELTKIQWNLYKVDTIRSKKSVRFTEMSA